MRRQPDASHRYPASRANRILGTHARTLGALALVAIGFGIGSMRAPEAPSLGDLQARYASVAVDPHDANRVLVITNEGRGRIPRSALLSTDAGRTFGKVEIPAGYNLRPMNGLTAKAASWDPLQDTRTPGKPADAFAIEYVDETGKTEVLELAEVQPDDEVTVGDIEIGRNTDGTTLGWGQQSDGGVLANIEGNIEGQPQINIQGGIAGSR